VIATTVKGRELTSGKLAKSPNSINLGNTPLGAPKYRKLTEIGLASGACEHFLEAIFARCQTIDIPPRASRDGLIKFFRASNLADFDGITVW
jgi:hypothetical protein